jgi:hypothetical protein
MRLNHQRLVRPFALATTAAMIATMLALTFGAGTAAAKGTEEAQTASLYELALAIPLCPTGFPAIGATHGFAVLNTPGDESVVTAEVSVQGGKPNATYVVALEQYPPAGLGSCPAFPTEEHLQTNGEGNGNLHFQEPRVSTATTFWIAMESFLPFQALGSPAVTLD